MGFHTIQSIWREGFSEIHMRAIGDALVRVLRHAGPFYVKVGQILSTRDDLLPEVICQQLAELYEKNSFPMSSDEVSAQLQKNYPSGVPFVYFDETPLGMGTVSQVHRATLENGQEVVVKVLRPNIGQYIERDIEATKLLVKLIFERMSDGAQQWLHAVTELIDDIGESFKFELNLLQEATNMIEFRRKVEDLKNIFIPMPYPAYSTREVLVMEEVKGITLLKLRHTQMLSPVLSKKVASLALKEIIKQILEVGVFHPDPHGGNLILMPDDRLGMVDLAQTARFGHQDKRDLVRVLQSILLRDAEKITSTFLSFGNVSEDVDVDALTRDLQQEVSKDEGLGRFAGHVLAIVMRHRVTLNAETIALVRSLITVEALSRSLDPDFNVAKTAIPTLLFSFVKSKFYSKP